MVDQSGGPVDFRIEQADGTLVAWCSEDDAGVIVCRTRVYGAPPQLQFEDRAALAAELARIPVLLTAVGDDGPIDLPEPT